MSEKIKVRIALCVGANGNWGAYGCGPRYDRIDMMNLAVDSVVDPGLAEARYWITAEVELPKVGELAGEADIETCAP